MQLKTVKIEKAEDTNFISRPDPLHRVRGGHTRHWSEPCRASNSGWPFVSVRQVPRALVRHVPRRSMSSERT
jgi:hypothetical protein